LTEFPLGSFNRLLKLLKLSYLLGSGVVVSLFVASKFAVSGEFSVRGEYLRVGLNVSLLQVLAKANIKAFSRSWRRDTSLL